VPEAPSGRLSLVSTDGAQSVVHPLAPGPNSVGCAVDNDLVVSGQGVMPHHAVLTLEGDEVALRDLFAGETRINDVPCTSGTLRAGDALTLGRTRLRLMQVATTTRMARPDPKDDTTKRTQRRSLQESGGFRRASSRRLASGALPRTRRTGEEPTSARRRRPSGQGQVDGRQTSGTRRRPRGTKDWLGELNHDPEETQGIAKPKGGATQELQERLKRLTTRLRKAETRARSAKERLKHLEQEGKAASPSTGGSLQHFDLSSLHELCSSMVDEPDLERVLELIAEGLLYTFGADRAVLILTEEDGRNPLINVERVRGGGDTDEDTHGVAPEVLEETLYTRRPLEVHDEEGGLGGLAAPILRGGRTFGILYFERNERTGAPIQLSDKQLMSVFATLACLVIQPLMSEELT